MTFEGKTALVTGAATGIGQAIAAALADAGARVIGADIAWGQDASAPGIDQVVCDVTDPASIRDCIRGIEQRCGGVDILVNNAAIATEIAPKPFEQIAPEEWTRVLTTNTLSQFLCSQAVIPGMRERKWGRIINLTSGTVFVGTPYMLHYVASKGAIVAMTRALAGEVGRDGITVNAVAPGLTVTEGVRRNKAYTKEMLEGVIASRAIPREETAGDLVGATLFLASDAADFFTGQIMVVDGGCHLSLILLSQPRAAALYKEDEMTLPSHPVDMVVANARLLNGDAAVLDGTCLVIDRGVIVAVLSDGASAPAARIRIDAAGRTVMPGIIDTHVHLTADPSAIDLETARNFLKTTVYANMSKFLDGGVTTIRSMGDHYVLIAELRATLEKGLIEGPRLQIVGAGISMRGGHPGVTVLGRLPYLNQYANAEASTVEEVRAAVDRMAAIGADAIKVIYDGADDPEHAEPNCFYHKVWGVGALKRLTPEMLKAAIDQAHTHGLRAFVHVEDEDSSMRALQYGASGIEHGLAREFGMPTAEFLAKASSSGASYAGTLQVYEILAPDTLTNAMQQIKRVADAGTSIVTGTDIFGDLPITGRTQREMELLVESGIEPAVAVQAATRNAAKSLGLSDRIGMLDPGMIADIIIIDGDPLENISATRAVAYVIQAGRIVRKH